MVADSGADFGQFCTSGCTGLEGEHSLCGVAISNACVTGEDEVRDDRTVETSSRRERMARPEEELCTGRSTGVRQERNGMFLQHLYICVYT